jgi:diacylglycerol O-acyltransferase / trehalose O-mycolyltransferase
MRDLTIDSPALGRTAMVRLLLPRHFTTQPNRRWPVLWLLHGCCDTYQSWTRSTDVEQLAGLADVLVVMPEAGDVGYYSDWYHPGRVGPSRWETFHLTELRQLLERDWRAGDRRVIAGLSMGGLGAMAYAARHPGMFRAAASYSGVLHTRYQGDPTPGTQIIQGTLGTSTKIPTPCGATRSSRPTSGPPTTPTTLPPSCATSACSCRSATGSRARSTIRPPADKHKRSSRPPPRTPPS